MADPEAIFTLCTAVDDLFQGSSVSDAAILVQENKSIHIGCLSNATVPANMIISNDHVITQTPVVSYASSTALTGVTSSFTSIGDVIYRGSNLMVNGSDKVTVDIDHYISGIEDSYSNISSNNIQVFAENSDPDDFSLVKGFWSNDDTLALKTDNTTHPDIWISWMMIASRSDKPLNY